MAGFPLDTSSQAVPMTAVGAPRASPGGEHAPLWKAPLLSLKPSAQALIVCVAPAIGKQYSAGIKGTSEAQ